MDLAEARRRVLRFVDESEDDENRAHDDDAIEEALQTAQEEVYSLVVGAGSSIFTRETALTTSAVGVADLTDLDPLVLQLESVAIDLGNGHRAVVQPAETRDGVVDWRRAENLLITYVPRPEFPAEDADLFVWGSANVTMVSLFEKAMVLIAASELLVPDGEVNQALERRKAEVLERIVNLPELVGWTVSPLTGAFPSGRYAHLRYVITGADTLQLVTG